MTLKFRHTVPNKTSVNLVFNNHKCIGQDTELTIAAWSAQEIKPTYSAGMISTEASGVQLNSSSRAALTHAMMFAPIS